MPTEISIITGSTGNAFLSRNIESVNKLDVPDGVIVKHVIVVDGQVYENDTRRIVDQCSLPPTPRIARQLVVLPENTGGDGFLCHRIIATMSFASNADYMCVLDEDNEVDPCHIIVHLNAIGPHRWSFTLRTIIDAESKFVCDDVCESMGNIRPTCLSPSDRLIDTNCYMFRMDLARELAPLWMVRARQQNTMEADRRICQTLLAHEPKGGSTREFSVRYRAAVRQGDGNEGGSVTFDFFKHGNARVLPWTSDKKDVYLYHFDAERTELVLRPGAQHDPLAEWCMTMYDEVRSVNWINGYSCLHALPYDAICLVTLCHPSKVPLDHLKHLKESTHTDIKVILATLEGPNARHRAQWTPSWLKAHADVVMTFCRPLLNDPTIPTVFWPHNARFLRHDHFETVLRQNEGRNTGTVAMVLENRDTSGEYEVCGKTARSLDHKRRSFATGFGPMMTVVGGGWRRWCDEEREAGRPVPSLGYDMPRHMDHRTPIDTYQRHDFALIIENCGGDGAVGYVSEKVGDALIAGAIPLYWGENVDPLSPIGAMMEQGRGKWWIDVREMVSTSDTRCLGEQLKACLEKMTPDEITVMKDDVLRRREGYLLGVGTRAFSTGLGHALGHVSF